MVKLKLLVFWGGWRPAGVHDESLYKIMEPLVTQIIVRQWDLLLTNPTSKHAFSTANQVAKRLHSHDFHKKLPSITK